MTSAKIVVGADGSESSKRAIAWCAANAGALGCEVVVVHAIDFPIYLGAGFPHMQLPEVTEAQHKELRDVATGEWCKPLADAGVANRVVMREGFAAEVIIETARQEDAQLVVTGRRGRGGFAELVLGSTSHALTHHVDRPLVIVP
jgi:nucleotide-binding universal stress UspA family protein